MFQWRALPNSFISLIDVFKNRRFAHKETRIYPAAIAHRLLNEAFYPAVIAVKINTPKPALRLHGGHGYSLAMRLVEFHQFINLHIAHSITAGKHKRLIAFNLAGAGDTAARHGILARIY